MSVGALPLPAAGPGEDDEPFPCSWFEFGSHSSGNALRVSSNTFSNASTSFSVTTQATLSFSKAYFGCFWMKSHILFLAVSLPLIASLTYDFWMASSLVTCFFLPFSIIVISDFSSAMRISSGSNGGGLGRFHRPLGLPDFPFLNRC